MEDGSNTQSLSKNN